MRNTFQISADLKKKMYISEPTVTQNDDITFIVSVFDNGEPFSLAEVTTASLANTRMDGTTVVTLGTIIDNNKIQFDLGTNETAIPGKVQATIQLYDENERVSTIAFTYRVVKDPTGSGYVPTKNEQTLIEVVLNNAPLVIQQARDAANFANEQGQFAQEQASAASEVATRANEAAQFATDAATNANTAAQSANEAAQSVNEAVTLANIAAQNANDATANANEAADNATTQAQYARQQGDYAKVQGDYAKVQGDYAKTVADANKTRLLTPVETFADISTTYPNPQFGDTVQTLDDGKFYRYENGQWNFKEQYTGTAINSIVNELSKQNKQSTTIGHGLNIINASQNSPLDVRIEGQTLVNLLGVDGNFETDSNGDGVADNITIQGVGVASISTSITKYGTKSQRINYSGGASNSYTSVFVTNSQLKSGSYYVALCDAYIVDRGKNISLRVNDEGTDWGINLGQANYPQKLNQWVTAYIKFQARANPVRIITYTEGSSADVYLDGIRLYEITVEEYNNIGTIWNDEEVARRYPYVDSVQHVQNPYVIAEGDNLLPPFTEWNLHANARVKSPYELELNATADYQASDCMVKVLPNTQYTISFSGSMMLYVRHAKSGGGTWDLLSNRSAGTYTFTTNSTDTQIQIRFQNPTGSVGIFTCSNPMLTLGSTPKPFVPKNPSMLFAEVKLGALSDKKDILWKDGQDWKVLKWVEKDVVLDGSLEWVFLSDGTNFKKVFARYILPYAMNVRPYELIKYNGLPSRKNYNGGEGAYVGDNNTNVFLAVPDTDTGWGETYRPTNDEVKAYFWGWRMCNGTYGQPYDGTGTKTWYPIGDSDLSRSVTTCPTSAAPTIAEGKIGYYKLSYVHSTPVTEVVTDKVEGDLVVNGATQVEVGSGVVIREKANPKQHTLDGSWHINIIDGTANVPIGSQLKNRAAKIIKIYKNGVEDKAWSKTNNRAYGAERAYIINNNDFDSTAEYTVTYLVLDRHLFTTNILAVTATYDSSLKSVVDSVVAKQSDLASNQQALIRSVAELYKRVKALGG